MLHLGADRDLFRCLFFLRSIKYYYPVTDLCSFSFLFLRSFLLFILSFTYPSPPLHSVVRGLTVIVSSHLPATYGGSPPLSLHFDRIFTPELESSREPRLQQRHHGLL